MNSLRTQNFEMAEAGFDAVAEALDPTPVDPDDPLEISRRRDTRALSATVRQALPEILALMKEGAQDLRNGNDWSCHLNRFEALSMEQVRILADFPIGADHRQFGALVRRARSSFAAFREMARRQIIGKVDAVTDPAALDSILGHIANRAALAVRSLRSLESALAE